MSLRPTVDLALAAGAAMVIAAGIAPTPAAAQRTSTGTVSGVVTDSTTRSPLVGATVQLSLVADPTVGFSTSSDSLGDFRIDGVPAGRYAIGFFHPRLDSLSLQPPVRALTVADSGVTRADLGVPSPETVFNAVCAGTPGALLLGTVRDADSGEPIANGTVTGVWAELRIDERGLRNERRILNSRSDSGGRFMMCGIPTDVPVRLQAATGASSAADESGEVELTFQQGRATWRDLRVGRGAAVALVAGPDSAAQAAMGARITRYRRGTARLVGQVSRRDGNPQGDAQVLLDGSGLTATTNDRGLFSLDSLPPGTSTVEIRALGFPPTHSVVDLASGRTDTVAVRLPARLPVLDPVTVFGDRDASNDATGFLKRSRGGAGYFVTPQQIANQPALDVTDYLRQVPGLRVVPTGGFGGEVLIRNCSPTIYVDGMQVLGGSADLTNIVQAADVAGIEVYNSTTSTPAQFLRSGSSCGTVVIWTKGRLR